MSIWRRLFGYSSTMGEHVTTVTGPVVNPATGLPMIDNTMGGVDVGGSPFGQDIHQSQYDFCHDPFPPSDWSNH